MRREPTKRDPFAFMKSLRNQDRALTQAVQQQGTRSQALQRAAGGGSAPASQPGGSAGDPKAYARQKLQQRGVGDNANYQALVRLWQKESGWNPNATNRSSGAHGIAQMMPMHGRREGAQAQIDWGIDYIMRRYGSPAAAMAHSDQTNWY